ncbi:MOSC domain-containing protein [Mariniblastus sp.]|nr:MOSC domain-containing protein [Mariniblastus sp.]
MNCDLLKIKKRNVGNAVSLEMKQLLATMPQVGKVEWIGVRPGRREPLNVLPSVDVSMEGLVGDRYRGKAGGPRMVTLIQQEHIATVESILKIEAIDPGVLRRNVVVSGINLQALKKRRIQIGGAILEVTGNCPPCSRMEENLGGGGYNAMRGHGGVTATVIQEGTIHCGDSVMCLAEATNER